MLQPKLLPVGQTTMYLGLVLYAPSLVLSAVTPLPIWASVLAIGVLACAYTVKGGMIAVIWTDFIQSLVMLSVGLFVFVAAIHKAGGFEEIWSELKHYDRLPDREFWSFSLTNKLGKGENRYA